MPEEKHRPSDSEDKPPLGLAAFWAELKRRKVMRVAITYAVVAWLVIQIAVSTFPSLYIPQWALSLVIMCVLLGFPVAIILAWAFELTPDGIKTTRHAREEQGAIPLSAGQQKKRNWMAYLVGALIPTLIFGTLALVFYFQAKPEQEPQEPLTNNLITQSTDKSIAVLPLENLSPDPDNAFFAGGVHEDILTNLSRIRDLRVISRNSTLDYVGANRKKSAEIAIELNVRYLVEGSVRRAGNQVRVTVQLIDAPNDAHIWAENYDRSLDDIFAIQSEIAQAIAYRIHTEIAPEELQQLDHRPTQSQEAYDLYLKAREIDLASAAVRTDMQSLSKAIENLETALRIDPQFALAHAYIVKFHCLRHWFYSSQYPDALEKARMHLEKAEAMDAPLAEQHLYKGYYYYWGFHDYSRAAQEFALALSENPNWGDAFFALALIQIRQGQRRETLESLERGLIFDPRSPDLLTRLVDSYASFRRYSKAAVMANRLAALDSSNPLFQMRKYEVQFYRTGEFSSLDAYLKMRNEASNLAFGDTRLELRSKSRLELHPYRMALYEGQFSEALAWLRTAQLNLEIPPHERHYALAIVLWLTRERERAKQEAELAVQAGGWYIEEGGYLGQRSRELARLAIAHAIVGDRERTINFREKTLELLKGSPNEYRGRDEIVNDLLPSYIVLGETEKAFEILDELMSRPGDVHAQEIRVDPFWREFHGDPRFEAILAKAAPVEE